MVWQENCGRTLCAPQHYCAAGGRAAGLVLACQEPRGDLANLCETRPGKAQGVSVSAWAVARVPPFGRRTAEQELARFGSLEIARDRRRPPAHRLVPTRRKWLCAISPRQQESVAGQPHEVRLQAQRRAPEFRSEPREISPSWALEPLTGARQEEAVAT